MSGFRWVGLVGLVVGCSSAPAKAPARASAGVQAAVTIDFTSSEGAREASCSGVLLSSRFVLTAAHCGETAAKATVFSPAAKKSVGVRWFRAYDWVPGTSKFLREDGYHDIALLELDEPIKLDAYAALSTRECDGCSLVAWSRKTAAAARNSSIARLPVRQTSKKTSVGGLRWVSRATHDGGSPYVRATSHGPVVVGVLSADGKSSHGGYLATVTAPEIRAWVKWTMATPSTAGTVATRSLHITSDDDDDSTDDETYEEEDTSTDDEAIDTETSDDEVDADAESEEETSEPESDEELDEPGDEPEEDEPEAEDDGDLASEEPEAQPEEEPSEEAEPFESCTGEECGNACGGSGDGDVQTASLHIRTTQCAGLKLPKIALPKIGPAPRVDPKTAAAKEFEARLNTRGNGAERAAMAREEAAAVAKRDGLEKNGNLQKKNDGRPVYEKDGEYYALDSAHGRWEKYDKNGRHLGEFDFGGNLIPNSVDSTRRLNF